MNIRFGGINEIIWNLGEASKAALNAKALEASQLCALTTIDGYDHSMGKYAGLAEGHIKAALNDSEYDHFVPGSDRFANTFVHVPQTGHNFSLEQLWRTLPGTSHPDRKDALEAFATQLKTVSTQLSKTAPTLLLDALTAALK